MNTHDTDIELPPLPELKGGWTEYWTKYAHEKMQDYARAAIEADRKRRGEPVAWLRKNGFRFNAEIEPRDDSELPLYTTPQSAEPVKKKPYAQGTALGEFGIIPMCDQVNDEPVKVPSDAISVVGVPEFDALMDHIYENGTASEGVLPLANAFARAVLARYTAPQPAEPSGSPTLHKADSGAQNGIQATQQEREEN